MEELEKKIRDSKECIKNCEENSSHKIYAMATKKEVNLKTNKFTFNRALVIKFAIIVLLFGVFFTGGFFLSKAVNNEKTVEIKEVEVEKLIEKIIEKETVVYRDVNPSNNDIVVNQTQVVTAEQPLSFGSFTTQDDLVSFVANNKANVSVQSRNLESADSGAFYFASSVKTDSIFVSSEPTSTYQTNTQVENVDEADIVKVSGNHIFYIPSINNARYLLKNSDRSAYKFGLKEKETAALVPDR